MTSEQLEAARAERMRQNGYGALTLEDARTWLEETGLCFFLPKRQFSTSLAPSFVEAVAGQHSNTPDAKQIAIAEELLVRLEIDGVAVRLNLLGQPGEQPDYVVAAWVLPYVYALRGDRDWRRNPQLTGSRQVSPLAVQAYKRLETGDSTLAELKHSLGQGVSEMAVLRAITELWQQLRIIPVLSAPGKAAKWQLLKIRYQKAIAEGASTSQVTAISVLASIFLQAVIAASMEEVEIFLAPLTARSKIREVLRGLVATRQVHTLSLGHAPHFYVAGTLPEFSTAPTVYASSLGSAYLSHLHDHEPEETLPEPVAAATAPEPVGHTASGNGVHRNGGSNKNGAGRTHFARSTGNHARDRKPANVTGRRTEGRPARPAAASRPGSATRWSSSGAKSTNGSRNGFTRNGNGAHAPAPKGAKTNGTERSANGARGAKAAATSWNKRGGNHSGAAAKPGNAGRTAGLSRSAAGARKDSRTGAQTSRTGRKPALTAGTTGKRFSYAAKQGSKKRG
ncbi:MAG TPA: hypothetical protein VG225_17085 [Terracidiphilus sp.]|nr:hypothetical protein [Terracidiphilus sp.]